MLTYSRIASNSACDTPLSLVNLTFDWLSSYSNSFDFVVWSGDSARHDSDPFLSRELDEIIELNTLVADKIKRTFPGTPVIPAVGNNVRLSEHRSDSQT